MITLDLNTSMDNQLVGMNQTEVLDNKMFEKPSCYSICCPFCCKQFSSDKRLLSHVKNRKCVFKQAKKNESKDDIIYALNQEVATLRNIVQTLSAKFDQMALRLEAVCENDVNLLEKVKELECNVPAKRQKSHVHAIRDEVESDQDENGNRVVQMLSDDMNDTTLNVLPFDRASIVHISSSDMAKCIRDFEIGGIKKLVKLVYFNDKAQQNMSVRLANGRIRSVHIYTDDNTWETYSKNSALKRITKQVLNFMSAKLDDSDVQDDIIEHCSIPQAKLDQVIEEVDKCINDGTGKTHKRFYDDIWCLIMGEAKHGIPT